MKTFCEHHQPWFKCGVCEAARKDAERIAEAAPAEEAWWEERWVALMGCRMPSLSCRIEG